MQQCMIIETQVEHFTTKRAWFVKAFRIVDAKSGHDLVQPYFEGRGGRKSATRYAVDKGWEVVR